MTKFQVDINSDVGESFGRYNLGNDAELMNYISSANIACGLHGGDPIVMEKTIRLARERNVGVGAHPSYPDLQGFGRRSMDMTTEELESFILYQIGALYAFSKAANVQLRHLKCHGALGNDLHRLAAEGKTDLVEAVGRAVLRFSPDIIMVAYAGSAMGKVWIEMGLKVVEEVYADRAYNSDLTLVSRRIPGSVITDPEVVVARAVDMVKTRTITAMDGTKVRDISVDTICVHGDTPTAVVIAKRLRESLVQEGVTVKPFLS